MLSSRSNGTCPLVPHLVPCFCASTDPLPRRPWRYVSGTFSITSLSATRNSASDQFLLVSPFKALSMGPRLAVSNEIGVFSFLFFWCFFLCVYPRSRCALWYVLEARRYHLHKGGSSDADEDADAKRGGRLLHRPPSIQGHCPLHTAIIITFTGHLSEPRLTFC